MRQSANKQARAQEGRPVGKELERESLSWRNVYILNVLVLATNNLLEPKGVWYRAEL